MNSAESAESVFAANLENEHSKTRYFVAYRAMYYVTEQIV